MTDNPVISVMAENGIVVPVTLGEIRDEVGAPVIDAAVEIIVLRKVGALQATLLTSQSNIARSETPTLPDATSSYIPAGAPQGE